MGYFQMFRGHRTRLYRKSNPEYNHDDITVADFIGPKKTQMLPFFPLHFGETNTNWSGVQRDARFGAAQSILGSRLRVSVSELEDKNTRRIIHVGVWLAAPIFRGPAAIEIFILDTRNLTQRSDDVLEEADRIFCWNRFVQGVADCPNVFLVGTVDLTPLPVPNSDEVRVRLPMRTAPMPEDGSVDLLHFGHEPAHEFIFEKLVPYLGKLKPGGWLSGSHYGLPGFPQTTSTIELLLGTPEIRDAAGGWAVKMRESVTAVPAVTGPLAAAGQHHRREASVTFGVVLYVHDAEDATRALTAVFSLREQYDGPFAVLMWGKEVPALRIACARLGVEYVSIMDMAKARGDGLLKRSASGEPAGFQREQARLLAMEYSPFAQTVMVSTDSTMPQPARWRRALVAGPSRSRTSQKGVGRSHYLWEDEAGKVLGFVQTDAGFTRWHARMRTSLAGPIRKTLKPLAALRGASPMKGSSGIPLVSPEAEAALIIANPAHVWWPKDCSVVTAPMAEDVEALEKNWRSMKWPAEMMRWAVPMSDEPLVLPIPALEVSPYVLKTYPNEAYWIQAILTAAARCKTKRLLYLDPCMRPVPGAELFYREADQSAAYASAGWCFVRRGKKVLKTPKLGPPATLFDTAFLKRAAKAFAAEKKERNFEVFLHAFAKKEKRTVTVQDVMPCGWNR